ncbi:cobyric acid synthase [Thalassotalea sp. Y01]|uniref:cobyric acid synthase n=1 Tax=Thalassotalea sp. Y01 TaxID=2729613 RepID=UPI0020071092|nr:cobyric acid synthase [Thalassotalea sp. Y01]
MNNNLNTANTAMTVMVQGTTSDAGKTTLVAALCRIFANKKLSVAPFKPQNMALNSAVTDDGGEIGRAQAMQANAARVAPHTDFNPILLKPHSDTKAQIIVHGKALSAMQATTYHAYKPEALKAVMQSHQRLCQTYQYIFVEGAGSPAEINLREGDIANMGFAEAADCPVIIIADIDKGGVFAHLVGTLDLLSQSEQDRVVGFVINRFRGDISLLQPGIDWLEQRTGKPVLGVLPYLYDLRLSDEDGVNAQQSVSQSNKQDRIKIVVPVLPRMSNHSDFDVLRWQDNVELIFHQGTDKVTSTGTDNDVTDANANLASRPLPACDLIILPGSKHVQADLSFLRQQGWHHNINQHLRYGGKVIGICGGLQMLGCNIMDAHGVESDVKQTTGLGLLAIDTSLSAQKQLAKVDCNIEFNGHSLDVSGYEIHAGKSCLQASNHANPTKRLHVTGKNLNQGADVSDEVADAYTSEDGQIMASYLHGIFDQQQPRNAILEWVKPDACASTNASNKQQIEDHSLDYLAQQVSQHLDIDALLAACTRFYQSANRAQTNEQNGNNP